MILWTTPYIPYHCQEEVSAPVQVLSRWGRVCEVTDGELGRVWGSWVPGINLEKQEKREVVESSAVQLGEGDALRSHQTGIPRGIHLHLVQFLCLLSVAPHFLTAGIQLMKQESSPTAVPCWHIWRTSCCFVDKAKHQNACHDNLWNIIWSHCIFILWKQLLKSRPIPLKTLMVLYLC